LSRVELWKRPAERLPDQVSYPAGSILLMAHSNVLWGGRQGLGGPIHQFFTECSPNSNISVPL
jgi:hypothetical protein